MEEEIVECIKDFRTLKTKLYHFCCGFCWADLEEHLSSATVNTVSDLRTAFQYLLGICRSALVEFPLECGCFQAISDKVDQASLLMFDVLDQYPEAQSIPPYKAASAEKTFKLAIQESQDLVLFIARSLEGCLCSRKHYFLCQYSYEQYKCLACSLRDPTDDFVYN